MRRIDPSFAASKPGASRIIWIIVGTIIASVTPASAIRSSVLAGSKVPPITACPPDSIVMVSVAAAARWNSGGVISVRQPSGNRPKPIIARQLAVRPAWLSMTPFDRPVVPPV